MTIQQRLTRSRNDKVIAGVCGGLGRYLGIDPVLVRLVMVALVFAGGISILIYPILWLAMPVDTGVPSSVQPSTQQPSTQQPTGATLTGYTMPSYNAEGQPIEPAAPSAGRNGVLGALMLGVGAFMLASYFGNPPLMLALLALAGGVYLLRRK